MGDVGATKGQASIDTRLPFVSVKDAVTLFGEKILAGKVYCPDKHDEMERRSSNVGSNTNSELEEAKQRLEESLDEAKKMAKEIESVRQELERTRRQIEDLKSDKWLHNKEESTMNNPEIEEIKFVESKTPSLKRFVGFSSPPSMAKGMDKAAEKGLALSVLKEDKKKKPLGWLLYRKKRTI